MGLEQIIVLALIVSIIGVLFFVNRSGRRKKD